MPIYWVYFLLVGDPSRGNNRKIYTGYSKKLKQRIAEHSGLTSMKGARLTRKQQIKLVYLEKFHTQKEALKRERELKTKSPFNQKKYKLKLIQEFQTKYGQILDKINKQLDVYFEFLGLLEKTMNEVEKELLAKLK